MIVHIKHNKNVESTKIIERDSSPALLQIAKEMAKVMAKEMAREMAKELIANLPAQQIVQIRQEGSGGTKDDLIAIDDSIVDVTKDKEFKKNFEALGQEKVSDDKGSDKRDKLRALKNQKK